MQCLLRGASEGNAGILVMFEERAATVRQDAWSRGWDIARLEKQNRLCLMDARLDPKAVIAGEFSINGLLAALDHRIAVMRAKFVLIDAVDALLHLYDSPMRERHELYALHEWLLDRGMTTIMTVKAVEEQEARSRYAFLDFMADCVIHVDQRVTAQITTRRLRVIKYRGSGYGRNEYPFVINESGVHIIPMTSNVLQHRPAGARMSSGTAWLDDALAGGYRRGTAILIAGAAGAGKTTLACTFAQAACLRGERVLYVNFEESPEAMVNNMLSPGLALQSLVTHGTLAIRSYLPEAMGVEEHLFHFLGDLEEIRPTSVIVDAISACKRMGSEQAAFEYLMRSLNACKERGITCICLNQSGSRESTQDISGLGISSLIDTVSPPAASARRQHHGAPTGGLEGARVAPLRAVPSVPHHRSRPRSGGGLRAGPCATRNSGSGARGCRRTGAAHGAPHPKGVTPHPPVTPTSSGCSWPATNRIPRWP